MATNLFDRLPDGSAAQLQALHNGLADSADRQGSLDIAYRTVDTPVGTLLLAATDRGLLRVAYPTEGHERVLHTLAGTVSPRILHAPARLDTAAREIDEYFAGLRRRFYLPLDLRLSTGFRARVLAQLATIGYGHTATYAGVAAAAGSPKAVRAAGTACATNPVPIVLPCHRVIRGDGTSGGYVGGPDAKRVLLNLEATA